MKKTNVISLALILCLTFAGFSYVWAASDDITLHKSCGHCGMDRGSFNFSRMLIEYEDGTIMALCSIHCAALDLAINIDKTPKLIRVADLGTTQLINAETAFWVIGGKKPGVMSKRGKWAFEKKGDAENFMKTNQGQLVSFEEAVNAAYVDMDGDTKMIREKRKMRRMSMAGPAGHAHSQIHSDKNKCPVCGMFTSKFTDWNGRIEFKDSTALVFDGPKCTFKYYLDTKKYNPSRDRSEIRAITVKDYYSKTSFEARQAFFVIWGDLYGPMGHEPIPFQKEGDARKYLEEHKGKKILRFDDISPDMIVSLDNP